MPKVQISFLPMRARSNTGRSGSRAQQPAAWDRPTHPGHLYSAAPSATMGETRRQNYVFRPRSLEEWLSLFGA